MSSIFRVPSDREPLIDPDTGLIGRSWFLFFQDLFRRVGGATGTGNAAIDAALEVMRNELAFVDSADADVAQLRSMLSEIGLHQAMADVPNYEIVKRVSDLEVLGAFSR